MADACSRASAVTVPTVAHMDHIGPFAQLASIPKLSHSALAAQDRKSLLRFTSRRQSGRFGPSSMACMQAGMAGAPWMDASMQMAAGPAPHPAPVAPAGSRGNTTEYAKLRRGSCSYRQSYVASCAGPSQPLTMVAPANAFSGEAGRYPCEA